ncbi:MAG: hypothetical protein QNI87_02695 [Erythrobacter sp.]|uniref:hypothetical protein n=1 Tax=Erythrobacter sp. TaxID=1042 RepID=UPI002629A208|nr:hypothetical protein [Erythrobacter sp.]MDJ0977420.1 hypothetical protein [Erythrobacter sp.]
MKRIDAALARMDTARSHAANFSVAEGDKDASGSARVMELVNRHEKLREEVAETMRELDVLIEDLEN